MDAGSVCIGLKAVFRFGYYPWNKQVTKKGTHHTKLGWIAQKGNLRPKGYGRLNQHGCAEHWNMPERRRIEGVGRHRQEEQGKEGGALGWEGGGSVSGCANLGQGAVGLHLAIACIPSQITEERTDKTRRTYGKYCLRNTLHLTYEFIRIPTPDDALADVCPPSTDLAVTDVKIVQTDELSIRDWNQSTNPPCFFTRLASSPVLELKSARLQSI
ncbi:hypothetical protein LZ31DRAFT_546549 [Colletotrichum somersetense]|nr:hypothetical protein LZ31DRAFT_546549 [Colletotrichum somersetense]